MVKKREKRESYRTDGNSVNQISASGNTKFKKLEKERNIIANNFADGASKNDRNKMKQAIVQRDNLRTKALKEVKDSDRELAQGNFIPLSPATQNFDINDVKTAMSNGTVNYNKYYNDTPDSLKNIPTTDLEPIKVQRNTADLIEVTQQTLRTIGKDKDKIDEEFKNILPVTDDKDLLTVFNAITPQNRRDLEADIEKFYTYISLNSSDPHINEKLVAPALAKSYVDYRASLIALQLQ